MLEICGIIGFSKIAFFNFSVSERVNKIKKIKNYSKPTKFSRKSLFKKFQLKSDFFLFFTETLTLSFSVTSSSGHNTDLRLSSNISKTVTVNIALGTNFLMASRFIGFATVVI